ncbi:MAG: PAS domain-containing sensor histidine kinase [Endomicrobium sp.]|jgi:PAS domain S-box-containing protein|nr:PAS domain-containing sensor histidine kinase [Endomicrobium sp.]
MIDKEQIYLNNILQYVPGCIYWKDVNGVYLGCNQMEAEKAGLNSPKEIIGKTDYDLSWKRIAKILRETDRRIMRTEVPEEIIETAIISDDISLTMLTKKSPLYDKEGNVIGIIGVSIDITDRKKAEQLELENKLHESTKNLASQVLREQIYINNILQHVPGCIYWKDTNGVYLGCNQLEAEILGLNSPKDIIGKTDYDLSWKHTTKILSEADQRIIKTKTPEEIIETPIFSNNKSLTMLTKKSPLYDNKGSVIGIIGVSIDITDRKKNEELKAQNKLQEEIKIITKRVIHDIRSPLAALSMLTQYCQNLSEKERSILKNIAANIESIANDLLEKYKITDNIKTNIDKTLQDICVDLNLRNILNSKRYQYKAMNVIFKYSINSLYKFVFIKGDSSDFCRMISNLLNNSVEAMEDKNGIINIDFIIKEEKVEIKIKDNGKGIPKEMVNKIMNNIDVGTTKQGGHGIGMQQIKSTLKDMSAQILIESRENFGTEITLIFPKSKPPKWFADKLVLHSNDIVIILDDDISVHDIWRHRLENYLKDIKTKYFIKGTETINFINLIKEKDKIFLLADYELRNQEMNGIDIIEKFSLQKQSILVTSAYMPNIKDFNEKCNSIKILPKTYINDISITYMNSI